MIYAGHDYVEASMQFARRLEPENPDIGPYLAKYDPRHVFSTLADEKKVNPYLQNMIPFMSFPPWPMKKKSIHICGSMRRR